MTTVTRIIGDITAFEGDAIVNAANSELQGGGGVDGAIHAAGGPSILVECRRIRDEHGPLGVGQVAVTGGGDLTAHHLLHTVGPIWSEHDPEEAAGLLADCYRNSLDVAAGLGCRSIAFPNISTGVYGYPKGLAAEVAVETVAAWAAEHPGTLERIVFVCFDQANADLYEVLL